MKSLLLSFAGFFLATTSVSTCSMVFDWNYQPSSQNPTITVLKDGKAQENLTVIVSNYEGKPQFSLVTDTQWAVRLPTLPPGKYCLTTATTPLQADICLSIAGQSGVPNASAPTSFAMTLGKPWRFQSLDERLEAAKIGVPHERVKEFAGVVQNPVGAVIVGAKVSVVSSGSADLTYATRTVSDKAGHFAVPLDPGLYIAVIASRGFATRTIVFEVISSGSEELQPTKMEVWSSC